MFFREIPKEETKTGILKGDLEETVNKLVDKGFMVQVIFAPTPSGGVTVNVRKDTHWAETKITVSDLAEVEKRGIPGSELVASEVERLATDVEIRIKNSQKKLIENGGGCGPDGCMIVYPEDLDDIEEVDDGR